VGNGDKEIGTPGRGSGECSHENELQDYKLNLAILRALIGKHFGLCANSLGIAGISQRLLHGKVAAVLGLVEGGSRPSGTMIFRSDDHGERIIRFGVETPQLVPVEERKKMNSEAPAPARNTDEFRGDGQSGALIAPGRPVPGRRSSVQLRFARRLHRVDVDAYLHDFIIKI
jgi:hypothetical protein